MGSEEGTSREQSLLATATGREQKLGSPSVVGSRGLARQIPEFSTTFIVFHVYHLFSVLARTSLAQQLPPRCQREKGP
jgi:hypothetical protein